MKYLLVVVGLFLGLLSSSQDPESAKEDYKVGVESEAGIVDFQVDPSLNHADFRTQLNTNRKLIYKFQSKLKKTKNKFKTRGGDTFGSFIVLLGVLVVLSGFTLIILTTILPWWWFLIGIGVILLGLLVMAGGAEIIGGSGGGLFASLVAVLTIVFGAIALLIWGLIELIIWIVG